MATAAGTKVRRATSEAREEEQRVVEEETAPRFLYVVMMPVTLALTLGLIMYWLTLPLR
ncbi:MAG: hypothetical protein M5U28_34640 [Sandaracinaceae bacterium]|nr:hypothetical protein [Sandaracinaceae bacterium]